MGHFPLLAALIPMTALVHLAAGIGNIVFATPLLRALHELGYVIDLRLNADYSATASLLQDWCVIRRILETSAPIGTYDAVIPAIPPFYWPRFRALYRRTGTVPRPPDELFYQNEQGWYLSYARSVGYSRDYAPETFLPVAPSSKYGVTASTIVLAPGCKTGEMAAKRWPGFVGLADRFSDITVVGSSQDLHTRDGVALRFGAHIRNLAGRLSLRETAECLAAAGLVIANDSGLGHLAAALGTPTILLFGPTPDQTLGPMPSHVTILRSALPCQPCWWEQRFRQCGGSVDCLRNLSVDQVEQTARRLLSGALV
jgi:ADP-heptose:LPS heptosyltransferase